MITKTSAKSRKKNKEKKDLLKEHIMRNTRQRNIILEELTKTDKHPSADEVYHMVRKHLPRISLGTVYRNLEILSEAGKIQKIDISGTLKRFDWNPEKHYHIRCINCDRIDDVSIEFSENIEDKLYGATKFKIIGHRLEFMGVCPQCFEKTPPMPLS